MNRFDLETVANLLAEHGTQGLLELLTQVLEDAGNPDAEIVRWAAEEVLAQTRYTIPFPATLETAS